MAAIGVSRSLLIFFGSFITSPSICESATSHMSFAVSFDVRKAPTPFRVG